MRKDAVIMEDARILFKNFEGREERKDGQIVNGAGNQNFSVELPHDLAQQMIEDGWRVGILKPSEEGGEPGYYLKVNLSYRYEDPTVLMYTKSKGVETPLDRFSVAKLDKLPIVTADVMFTPWRKDENSPISGYLKELRVLIEDSPFEEKWASMCHPGEDE